MRENGTDRDLALLMLGELNAIAEDLGTIKDNQYAPVIFTQPQNVTGDIGETATFTVIAGNVSGYQWQYQYDATPGSWIDSALSGYNTNSLSMEITSSRYNLSFRCKITGKDGTVIYSNVVKPVAPEANG